MSTIKVMQLICDGTLLDGTTCYEAWQASFGTAHSATMQRREARVAGWKVERKGECRDLCPAKHREEEKDATQH